MPEWSSSPCVPWQLGPSYFGCVFAPISRHWSSKIFRTSSGCRYWWIWLMIKQQANIFLRLKTLIKNRSPLSRLSPAQGPILFWGVISLLLRGDFLSICNWVGGLLFNISVKWVRLLLSPENWMSSLFCQDKCTWTHFHRPKVKTNCAFGLKDFFLYGTTFQFYIKASFSKPLSTNRNQCPSTALNTHLSDRLYIFSACFCFAHNLQLDLSPCFQ